MTTTKKACIYRQIARLYNDLADSEEVCVPTPQPEPTPEPLPQPAPQPTQPIPSGDVQVAFVFLDGVHFDVNVNGSLLSKERPFDYTFLNPASGAMAGVKVVLTSELKTVELNPDQIRFPNLPNDGFGLFSIKVVNRDSNNDLMKINGVHTNPLSNNPNFYGSPAINSHPLGVIYSRVGCTVFADKCPDPQFYLGWREGCNAPRVFHPQWSTNKRIVFTFFNLGK